MAWSVMFGNVPLMSNTDGEFQFEPGEMSRAWIFEQLPRALGELAKDGGANGCDHKLTLIFHDLTNTSLATTMASLRALWIPATGSPPCSTLYVPDTGTTYVYTYNSCVVTNVSLNPMTKRGVSINASTFAITEGYELQATMTFRQLRR